MIEIRPVSERERKHWNVFVAANYPPVGGFMQSWEWGAFQEALGRPVYRFFIVNGSELLGVFTVVRHILPFGFFYDYAPRSPVFRNGETRDAIWDMLESVRAWALKSIAQSVFLRLEPPLEEWEEKKSAGFARPPYYIQPRYNTAVPLLGSEEEIVKSFHPSTRSNLYRAERRGVTVTNGSEVGTADLESFFAMVRETAERTGGQNAYPNRRYFESLLEVFGKRETGFSRAASLGVFRGYHRSELAAMHLVIFFGTTATYLYGASRVKSLSSKVTTYLHWSAIQEAKRRGCRYYDLGGVDEARWPSLTVFKRQFRGTEFRYIGNLDMVLRPTVYRLYNLLRRIRK